MVYTVIILLCRWIYNTVKNFLTVVAADESYKDFCPFINCKINFNPNLNQECNEYLALLLNVSAKYQLNKFRIFFFFSAILFLNLSGLISDIVIKLFLRWSIFTFILIQILRNQRAFPIKAKDLLGNCVKVNRFQPVFERQLSGKDLY